VSNRTLKLKLWNIDNRCYWCKKPTVLTSQKSGSLPPNAATIDHKISRYNYGRWLKTNEGEIRRVLACLKCNQRRCNQETICLSKNELLKRSLGYSLSPKGKPKIITPLKTIREVKKRLTE
jgi:hypothetical protein